MSRGTCPFVGAILWVFGVGAKGDKTGNNGESGIPDCVHHGGQPGGIQLVDVDAINGDEMLNDGEEPDARGKINRR